MSAGESRRRSTATATWSAGLRPTSFHFLRWSSRQARSMLAAAVVMAMTGCAGGGADSPQTPAAPVPTPTPSAVVAIDAASFDAVVLQASRPVMVEFYATWCSYCQRMAPTVEALAVRYAGRATVGKVDVDAQAALTARWGVKGYPTFVFFRGGQETARHLGMATEAELATLLDSALASSSRPGE